MSYVRVTACVECGKEDHGLTGFLCRNCATEMGYAKKESEYDD